MVVIGASPMVAPSIGALLLHVTSWRGVFILPAVLGLTILAAIAVFLSETIPPTLKRKSGFGATAATFGVLLRDRVFLGCVVTMGAATVAYISGTPFVVEDVYHHSPEVFPRPGERAHQPTTAPRPAHQASSSLPPTAPRSALSSITPPNSTTDPEPLHQSRY